LPLSQGFQLQHAALVGRGVVTVQSEESLIEELEDITDDLMNEEE
jgi:hypothetical protein